MTITTSYETSELLAHYNAVIECVIVYTVLPVNELTSLYDTSTCKLSDEIVNSPAGGLGVIVGISAVKVQHD